MSFSQIHFSSGCTYAHFQDGLNGRDTHVVSSEELRKDDWNPISRVSMSSLLRTLAFMLVLGSKFRSFWLPIELSP